MMYFLDFDRTVFDTDAFMLYLREKFSGTPISQLPNAELGVAMNDMIKQGTVVFAAGELARFLYADAAGFLRDKENGVMLITYGNPSFQKVKVESAITGIPRITTIYTNDVRKGDFMAPHIRMYGASPVFVDDAPIELEIFAAKCPGAKLFEMRRDGGAGDGRWSVIHSLSELP